MSLQSRVKAALAEAGYPNADVSGPDYDPSVPISPSGGRGGAPAEVLWRAFRICSERPTPCFTCWEVGYGDECAEGDCHAWEMESAQ